MQQTLTILTFETHGQGFVEITDDVNDWIGASGIRMGQVTLFCQHTSASLTITENASAAARRDLLRWLDKAAPESDGHEHDTEGSDDMPAHMKAVLTGNSLTIPLGRRQNDARYLAGRLPDRASPRGTQALYRGAGFRRMTKHPRNACVQQISDAASI